MQREELVGQCGENELLTWAPKQAGTAGCHGQADGGQEEMKGEGLQQRHVAGPAGRRARTSGKTGAF